MKNKKLVAILALTGAIANLGLATVFAANAPTGSQTIGCLNPVEDVPTLDTPEVVGFEARHTNFYVESDANAVVGDGDAVVVTDTRGYDAGLTEGCGEGFSLGIQSSGLNNGATINGQKQYNIQLKLGANMDEAWTPTAEGANATTFPESMTGVVTYEDVGGELITSEQVLIDSTEAVSGVFTAHLVDHLYASYADLQSRVVANPVNLYSSLSADIAPGIYEGTITFTLGESA